jgi:iron complex outermembrane receptor protein
MTYRQLTRIALTGCFSAITPLPAVADTSPALEEIVITANRRETNLMQTASAVSAFGSDARDELGIYSAPDLQQRTPSLTITQNKISIRGVGRPNNALGSDPGVGIYWDGVYRTENGIFSYSDFVDIERIEVLRGPQGTLYGRNSVGGAINFVSQQATPEWSGKLIAEYGNNNTSTLQGLASGPLTESLGILIAASDQRSDGYVNNRYNGDSYADRDRQYASVLLQHDTTPRWQNTLKLIYSQYDEQPNPGVILEPFNTDYIQPVRDQQSGQPLNFPGIFPGQNFVNMTQGLARENPALSDPFTVYLDTPPRREAEVFGATLTSEFEGDGYRLRYIGGYSEYDYYEGFDADYTVAAESGLDWRELFLAPGLPVSALTGFTITGADMVREVDQRTHYHSHEVQYLSDWGNDFNLIGGLYYYASDENQVVSFSERNDELMATYAFFAGLIGAPVSTENYLYRGGAQLDTTAKAVYLQGQWQASDKLALSLGLRYSDDDKDGGDTTFVQFVGNPETPTVERAARDSWQQTTWRLGIDYQLNARHFVYAFAASGYRSGGFNFQKPTADPGVDQVDPENLISYEAGYKGSFPDLKARLSAAVYYYDYTDLQVLRDEVVNGVNLNTFDNADQATAQGLELEGTIALTSKLEFSGSYSYNDTEYEDFYSVDSIACSLGPLAEGNSQSPLCTQAQDLSGNQFPLTPEHKASANLIYRWQTGDYLWQASGSYLYTGEQWISQYNNPAYDHIDAFYRLDARLSVAPQSAQWRLTLWCNNLSDEGDVVHRGRPSTVTGTAVSGVQPPRSYGLRWQYTF